MKFALPLIVALFVCSAVTHAQTTGKPTRIVVGFVAGGPSDLVARMVAQQLTERTGQSFIVENRPGATGTIGAELVAKAPPDGHTLYLASQTTHAVAPALLPNVN
jgi:tripartite-type tricarboxylate transporter receptor subunit TctC